MVDGAATPGLPRPGRLRVDSVEEALPHLCQAILPGDVVLVKGLAMMHWSESWRRCTLAARWA